MARTKRQMKKSAARRKRLRSGASTPKQERLRRQRDLIRANTEAQRALRARAIPMDDGVRSPTADPPEEQ
jgi:hypothetical protein